MKQTPNELDTDEAYAARFRARLPAATKALFAMIDEAKARGIIANINFGQDAEGKTVLTALALVKVF